MTAKDLKNALLQEAVQGKLVPQIASEGNARDLLEEIRKEKLSHGFANSYGICDGKNKKSKSSDLRSKSQISVTKKELPEITEEEIPFEIPENWCWCRLGEIAGKITDGEHKTPNRTNEYCGFYLLSARNILNGKISLDKVDYVDSNEFERIKKRCNPVKGDILISCSGSVGRSAVIIDENNYVMVRSAAMVKPIINNSFFLMFCIQSPCLQTQIQDSIKQAVQANLFQEAIRNLLIPLPPLAEQERIVAAIEKFMPLIEEYGKKETELKALNEQIGAFTKKAILQEAVQGKLVPQIAAEGNAKDLLEEIKKEKAKLIKEGKIKKEKPLPEITEDEISFDIPENWCWCRLGDICNVRGGKRIPAGRKLTKENTGHKYIRVTDMKNGTVLDNDVQYITDDIYKIIKAYRISKDDVYITVAGTIGQAGTIPEFFDNANLTENADKLELYNTDKKFLVLMLSSPYIQKQIHDSITKVGQPKLAIMRIQTLVIALPPLAEQKRIVAAIEKMLPFCEKLGE